MSLDKIGIPTKCRYAIWLEQVLDRCKVMILNWTLASEESGWSEFHFHEHGDSLQPPVGQRGRESRVILGETPSQYLHECDYQFSAFVTVDRGICIPESSSSCGVCTVPHERMTSFPATAVYCFPSAVNSTPATLYSPAAFGSLLKVSCVTLKQDVNKVVRSCSKEYRSYHCIR